MYQSAPVFCSRPAHICLLKCHLKLGSVTQYLILPKQLYLTMFIATNWESSLRSLASATTSILDPHRDSQASCCCLSCGDPAAMDLQDWPLHVVLQVQDEKMLGWANSKPWIWASVVAELVSLPAFLHSRHQRWLSHAPTPNKGQGHSKPHHSKYHNMVAGGGWSQLRMVLQHQHGFSLQYRPQTSS